MAKPIKKPSEYFFSQLFLLNPIDDRLLFSITFTLKNTSNEINTNENKVINNDNKSLLLENKGIFFKAKNKGTVASEPISEPPYININDNIIAHIKLGNFFLFLELLIIGIFFECMLFLQS